jgi:hypothetical protein
MLFAAQASMAEADVEDVTAAAMALLTDPDLALHRPVASKLEVRAQRVQQVIEDHAARVDMEDTSILKVRPGKHMDTRVAEALAAAEEVDTEVDGDSMDAEDLLLLGQEVWVGSI